MTVRAILWATVTIVGALMLLVSKLILVVMSGTFLLILGVIMLFTLAREARAQP